MRFVLDWSDLNVAVADPERLPIGRRVAREAAPVFPRGHGRQRSAGLALTLDRRHWNGLVFDYLLLSPMKMLGQLVRDRSRCRGAGRLTGDGTGQHQYGRRGGSSRRIVDRVLATEPVGATAAVG